MFFRVCQSNSSTRSAGQREGQGKSAHSLVALLLLLKLHRSEFRCSLPSLQPPAALALQPHHLVLPAVEISQPARSPQLRNGALQVGKKISRKIHRSGERRQEGKRSVRIGERRENSAMSAKVGRELRRRSESRESRRRKSRQAKEEE
eukprot:180826-Hanusia_phi.AAC.2